VARRPSRLALLEASCQGASEDFVPPAAQRNAVGQTPRILEEKQPDRSGLRSYVRQGRFPPL